MSRQDAGEDPAGSSPSRKKKSDRNGMSAMLQQIAGTATLGNTALLPVGDSSVTALQHWDVKMPPTKKHMVKGHLVPTVKSVAQFFRMKPRGLRIEIRHPVGEDSSLQPHVPRSSLEKTNILEDTEIVLLRVLKAIKSHAHGDDSTTGSPDHPDETRSLSTLDDDEHRSFEEHASYSMEDVNVLKVTGRTAEVKLGSDKDVIIRDIHFETDREATDFERIISRMTTLERDRAQRQIERYKQARRKVGDKAPGGTKKSRDLLGEGDEETESMEQINLLVEIVSAIDLPVADFNSTDAYVIARMGGKELHRTGIISKTLDPIWNLSKGSLFLLQKTPEEFFSSTGGLTLTIKDYDAFGANETLGRVSVGLEELLQGKGERTEYEIMVDKKMAKAVKKKGKLYLRFKEATADDIEFMNVYAANKKQIGVFADETFLPPRPPDTTLLRRQSKKNDLRQEVHRVKPYPDPSREEETKWLTKEQLNSEALKPSTNWTEAGSGDLGRLYIEIIGCDNLPNLDALTLNVRDRTDAFGCLLFEDCVVMTDVIGDSLSPRWMPWCRRSFVLNIAHPSSDVQLGIFDYDPELSPLQIVQSKVATDLHDPVGRIRINVSTFLQNTVYTLKYNLYEGELAQDRIKPRGTVTVRLRVEFNDIRKALIRGVMPPPPAYVSVAKPIYFQVAHYVAEGKHDETEFSMNTFASYVEELQSYESVLPYLKQAALTIWLWRGHHDVTFRGKTYSLPLHSMSAFFWGVLGTWDFNLFPSFMLFSIAWLFLACNEYARKNPSKWHKCRSYAEVMRELMLNSGDAETIVANENLSELEEFNRAQEEWKAQIEREREQQEAEEAALRAELGEELGEGEAEDEDITTAKGGILKKLNVNVNPLKPVLYPVQIELYKAVMSLRIAKSVLFWEETYYAFWITTVSLLAALASCWIPWGFLCRWLLRILVWTFLGPWMAIVDHFYFRSRPEQDDKEKDAKVKERLKSRYKEVLEAATAYHVKRERAVKLKDMKKFMFGKFLLRVPRFSEELFSDVPLPESTAEPYSSRTRAAIEVGEKKYGQLLVGDMIPQREIQSAHLKEASLRKQKTRKRRFRKGKKHADESSGFAGALGGETEPLLDRPVDEGYDAVPDQK